jgi:hypothetical protein
MFIIISVNNKHIYVDMLDICIICEVSTERAQMVFSFIGSYPLQ